MTELRRHRPRRVERPGRGRAARRRPRVARGVHRFAEPARAAPGRPALEPAASVHRGARGAAPARRSTASASTPGASTTRCSTARPRARAPLPLPRRAHRGMVERASRACAQATRSPASRHADQHRLPAARRRRGSALPRPTRSRWCRTCSPTGSAASWPTSARTPPPPGCSTRARGEWAHELIERLGLPARPFGALVEPGTTLGRVLAHTSSTPRSTPSPRHDTASAFAAAPLRDAHARDPVLRHLVAARPGAAGAGASRDATRPDQRARRRRHDPAAEERHGPVARAGVRARRGTRRLPTSCSARPATRAGEVPLSTPTTSASCAAATCPR